MRSLFQIKFFLDTVLTAKLNYAWRLVKSIEVFIILFPFFFISINRIYTYFIFMVNIICLDLKKIKQIFLMICPRKLFSWNIMCTIELTLIVSSGSQITKSASIPSDRLPLRSSRPHILAGWLLNSFEISESDISLVFAAVHVSDNPVKYFVFVLLTCLSHSITSHTIFSDKFQYLFLYQHAPNCNEEIPAQAVKKFPRVFNSGTQGEWSETIISNVPLLIACHNCSWTHVCTTLKHFE